MNERGSTLFFTIILMLVGMLILTGLFTLVSADYRRTFRSIQTTQAHYMAEAGIYRGIARLNQDETWDNGFQNRSFGTGYYSVTVEKSGMEEENIVMIHSEASIPPHTFSKLQVIYNIDQKKIVSWVE